MGAWLDRDGGVPYIIHELAKTFSCLPADIERRMTLSEAAAAWKTEAAGRYGVGYRYKKRK